MPRGNPATNQVALNRRDWYDYAANLTAWQDCSFPAPTPCKVVLSDSTVLLEHGATFIGGGGRTICCQLDSEVTVAIRRDQQPPVYISGAGAGPVGPDGACAVKDQYYSYGPWHVHPGDGTAVWLLTAGDAHDIQLLGGGFAQFTDPAGKLHLIGFDCANKPAGGFYGARVTFWHGRAVLLYQNQLDGGSLVLDGHTIAPPSANYNRPDVWNYADEVWVAWASTTADSDATVLHFTEAQLAALPPAAVVPPPQPITPLHKACWFGAFVFSPITSPLPPANCTLSVNVAQPMVRDLHDTVVAQYVAGASDSDPASIEQAIAAARAANPTLPVLAYLPRAAQAAGTTEDYSGIEAYQRAGESDVNFETYLRGASSRVRSAWLIAQCYTSNAGNTADLTTIPPIVSKVAAEFPSVHGILLFSAGARPTGWSDHPEVHPAWQQVYDSITGTPPIERLPEPPIPPEPKPPSLYTAHTRNLHMADQTGVFRGPGGKLARPDALHTGPWKDQGWRGMVFDGLDKTDTRYQWIRRNDTMAVSIETNGIAGCDGTKFSGSIPQQFYVKPDGDHGQGFAETWHFYDGNVNGAIEAQVEYAPGSGGDDGAFFGCPLAWEPLA